MQPAQLFTATTETQQTAQTAAIDRGVCCARTAYLPKCFTAHRSCSLCSRDDHQDVLIPPPQIPDQCSHHYTEVTKPDSPLFNTERGLNLFTLWCLLSPKAVLCRYLQSETYSADLKLSSMSLKPKFSPLLAILVTALVFPLTPSVHCAPLALPRLFLATLCSLSTPKA